MKKRLLSGLLAAVMLFAMIPGVSAAAEDESEVAQVLAALDIMVGDDNGNLNLSNNVTRAEFSKLAVASSTMRDSVGDMVSVSPYPDVPQSHWAASWIKAAVDLDLVKGNLQGYFEPDRSITLAEGVTIVLRLLGYQDTDFTGVWPAGQMAQYKALKLDEGITATQNSAMTRRDAMYLIYNTLIAKNTSGVYYLNVLEPGMVNSEGKVDRVALINSAMEGPVVAEGDWQSKVPFSLSNATVYRSGKESTLSSVQNLDVVYWSKSMRTIWAYTNKVTGTYEAASPTASSPTSLTLAGKTYDIETTSAAYDLSNLGAYKVGDSLTLLLGRDGGVAAVRSLSQATTTTIYGMVLSATPTIYQDSNGNDYTSNSLLIYATDGNQYTYPVDDTNLKAGALVRVTPQGTGVEIKRLSTSTVSGKVNADATKIGTTPLADDVEIIDVYTGTTPTAAKVYPSRLAGMTIKDSMVAFSLTNANGEISRLILKEATGDMHAYGLISTATNVDSELLVSYGNYVFDVYGTTYSYYNSGKVFNVSEGPCQIQGTSINSAGLSVDKLASLTKVNLDSYSGDQALSADNKTYAIAENVAVYLYQDRTYYYRSLSTIDSASYTLTGYYDKPSSEGGRIRVIIATAN
ncbi:MAG: S-layer homology domain-containing protein [Oscillospiraceae bacterium]|nr:S-layer homology domain-containing protein [Oscillospiraceae bacterium]